MWCRSRKTSLLSGLVQTGPSLSGSMRLNNSCLPPSCIKKIAFFLELLRSTFMVLLPDFPLFPPAFFSACVNLLRLALLTEFICSFRLVLGIHKLPANAATDITFPMKGWRGMVDWAKNSEDKVTVSKSILSSGLAGRQHSQSTPGENIFFIF